MNLKGEWKSTGDPTEVALQVFATKLGLGQPSLTAGSSVSSSRSVVEKSDTEHAVKIRFADDEAKLNKRFKFLVEFPFSSSIKRMSTIYYDTEQQATVVMCKGAVRGFNYVCNFSHSRVV